MARAWGVLLLLGALPILGACGGGGGGGGNAPAPQPSQVTPPTPPPAGGPLALTESNAVEATSFVMRQIEHTHTAADSVVLTANVLLWRRVSSATISCTGNVIAHLSNADNDGDGTISRGDVLRFEHTSCRDVTRDSTMAVTLADAVGGKLEGNVTFMVATDAGARIEGTFALKVAFDHTTLEQTLTMSDINLTVASGGATTSISDAESERFSTPRIYRIALSGRANNPALGGEFTFDTATPFGGDSGAVPASGELLLTGGASRARIQPSADPAFRSDHFAYQVDETGSGTYSAPRNGRWSSVIIGFIFCWDANTRPEITSLSLSPANPTVRDQLTASYSAVDADGDSVFYVPEWRVNGGPVFVGNGTTLPLDQFRKGDVVTFVLRASDSRAEAIGSVSMTIVNSPPDNVSVTFEPAVARTTDDLVARYEARDIDRDDRPAATFEWHRNGVPIPGQTGQVLPHTAQAKGEVITAVVHMSDGEAVTSAGASITIEDTPPVVVLPTDYPSVSYGQTLTFDVTASDVDGDSIGQFVLSHGPAGMTVNPTTGRVSWPMRGPGFTPEATMHYGVTLDRPSANLARGDVSLIQPTRQEPLYRTGLEAPLTSALVAGDFDGDGDEELLVAGQNSLYELEWTGTAYRQSWVYSSPLDAAAPPAALATADVDGDGRHEIFIAHGGYVTKLDGVERRPRATTGTGRPNYVIRDLDLADVDNDGRLDVVAIASLNRSADPAADATVFWFPAGGMSPFFDYPITEGSAIAVGNVDGDPQIEIVTNSGYVFDVFNWLNHWRYPTPFGWELDVGDLDGNGVDEIVASVDDGAVRAYDGVTRTATWTVPNVNTDAVVIADVVGDAREEVLIGDGVGGGGLVKIYAQTAPGTATLLDGVSAVGSDVPAIATGDVDHDGDVEVIWGSATPGPSITVAGGTPLDVEWTTADLSHGALLGPYLGGELARRPVGAPAVLFATTRSAGGGARLIGMDATTGDLTVGSDLGAPGNGSLALTVADYDADGTHEALLASSSGDTAYHRAYNLFSATTEWNAAFASAENGVAVAYGDLTGDGRADLAAIDRLGVVRAYDMSSNTLLWTSPTVLQDGRDVAIAELNGGGQPEIVVAAAERIRIYSRDGNATFVQTRINAAALPDLRDLEVGDLDGDGALEILALYGLPTSVQRLDATLIVRGGFDYWRWVRGLSIERSSFARKNLVFIENIEGDQIVIVDAASGEEVWESPTLLGTIPRDGVHFVDVAGNGALRIGVATSLGMYLTR